MTHDIDDDGCRVCGNGVSLTDGREWPDGQPVCWECLWNERTALLNSILSIQARAAVFAKEGCGSRPMKSAVEACSWIKAEGDGRLAKISEESEAGA